MSAVTEQRLPGQGDQSRAQQMVTLPYPLFQDLDRLPWSPWVMEGVSYKLLSVNNRTSGFTCLLKVEPGTVAPVHQHLGAIELLVLEGDIYYDPDAKGAAGDYMYEPAGDIHAPSSDGGCVLFCVFEGPIAGLAEDGTAALLVTHKLMGEMARGHGVAAGVHGLEEA